MLTFAIAATLLFPVAASAHDGLATRGSRTIRADSSLSSSRQASTRRAPLTRLAAQDPTVLATQLAERYWGAVPCGGQIAVRAEQPVAPGLDSTTDGWATFNSALGQNDLEAPASTYTHCTISLARWQWPTRLEMAADWNMFCLTVTHEMGHLLGYPHSLTPGSVMAPVFTDESSVPAICRAARARVEAATGLTHSH